MKLWAIAIDVGIHCAIVGVNLIKLLSKLLGASSTWIFMLFRLVLFVCVLLPWFLSMILRWMFSDKIIRNIPYGDSNSRFQRRLLDIYSPVVKDPNTPAPVYIFLSGGAWIIGYKAWGSLMGEIFQNSGAMFVSIDIRNFPQGDIEDMIADSREAVKWTLNIIASYGGDASQVYLVGQSAGAHILLCLLIKQLNNELNGIEVNWSVDRIKGFVGISGAYDLVDLGRNIHSNGLDYSLLSSIMRNYPSDYSPTRMIKKLNLTSTSVQLPAIHLFHGECDRSVPVSSARDLIQALSSSSLSSLVVYPGWTHTDPIIEMPFTGDDRLCDDIIKLSGIKPHENDDDDKKKKKKIKVCDVIIRIARLVNPF